MKQRTADKTYGKDYWDTLDSGNGYTDSIMWADIAHIIHEVFIVDKKVNVDRAGEHFILDMGCAFGYLVRHLRSRGSETFGLDYSRYALDRAPDDVKDNLHWFDLTQTNDTYFGQNRFTMITCIETLEHIPAAHSRRALGHCWRSLKPGGILVATICVEGHPDPYSDPTHFNIQTREWWEAHFIEAGFVLDDDKVAELQRFWLFSDHKGILVGRKR